MPSTKVQKKSLKVFDDTVLKCAKNVCELKILNGKGIMKERR